MSESHLGLKHPNRKRKGHLSESHRANITRGLLIAFAVKPHAGHKQSGDTKRKISAKMKGVKKSIAVRQNMARGARRGKDSHFYKHGNGYVTRLFTRRYAACGRAAYDLWRLQVLERDRHQCQMCGKKDCKLEVDHIKPWREFPELVIDLDNGRALCIPCHRSTPTWGNKYLAIVKREANL